MDIGSINAGSVDRSPLRAGKTDRGAVDRRHDSATESAVDSHDVHDTLQTAQDLAARLGEVDADRSDRVEAAAARLASGALDHPDVYRAAAGALLDSL